MARKPKSDSTKIEYTKHQGDTRVNIPTQELKDFVSDMEVHETRALYPRDPTLDPQLVWKGKDEQDREDLTVPTVPIYIQEKIHPSAIIENIRANPGAAIQAGTDEQPDLFGDFNGIDDFEKKIDFYHHEGHWTNRLILGDSLLVMNSLAEKEGLKGKVQMIYFDPPYGIKFGSNWQVSTRKRQVGDKAEDATRQPEQVRAFRDTWKLGIHSYLSYLRDRLVVARELLTESGSVFVQIGDENVHLVRNVLDEVFGPENFIAQIAFAKTTGFASDYIDNVCDHLIWYGKSIEHTKVRKLYREKTQGEAGASKARSVSTIKGAVNLCHDNLRPGMSDQLTSQGASSSDQRFTFNGQTWEPPSGMHWKTSVEGLSRLAVAGRVFVEGRSIRYLRFMDDFSAFPHSNVWLDIGGIQSRTDPKVYVVQTATEAVKRCILMTTDPGDLVLDPTCGSGTTAYVAEQWGRRWITIDTSRVALTLARTRLMAGRFPYYLLADSPEGLSKEAELTGKAPPSYPTENDVRKGFVYKRVPHVTLKSIANNPEIDGIAERYRPKIQHELAVMNQFRPDKQWNEWEVPAPPYGRSDSEPEEMKPFWEAFDSFWILKREMQAEIDKAILKHADIELLFDQPYEDSSRIRVTGPFTVESLAPHRVLQTDDLNQDGQVTNNETAHAQDFATMILDNLKKAGVQNTRKGERLKFDSLEPFAGTWIHAKGIYTDADGATKTVAVSIGPEFGTVGPEWIKEAAKEAVKGVGFDLLIVCGFSFDGYASEEAKQFGALTVLPVRMNNDLSMGDELLKKTGAGNLFMVFGEPDLKIQSADGGKITVEVLGLDVYDPTTGQIRSGSTDDLAVWFIDTNYNGESFFVRHAYFLGGDKPYDKLKRALRAEINEAAWSDLYSTKSQPFEKPTTGKIAVKVINHYGDEVLKVYEVK